MRTLSKIGWFCLGMALVLGGIVFIHYNGITDPGAALLRMIASAFWGGLVLGGLFIALMAVLFLSA